MEQQSRKRKAFDLNVKVSILEDVQMGKKKGEIAARYKIAPSTLSTIIKQKDVVMAEWDKCGSTDRKKFRPSPVEEVDKALELWFTQQRASNIPIKWTTPC